MQKIVLFSDSTCDLNEQLIKEADIKIVPLYVGFNEEIYKDGEEINPEGLYKKVKEVGFLPKTSATSMADFYEAFKPYIEAGKDIIYLGIGSKFSTTFNNAILAAREFDEGRVTIIDSENLSTSTGLLLLKTRELITKGKTSEEIKEEITKLTSLVRCKFAIESLDYLHKGGRCSGVSKFVGTLLRIKPIIEVKNGKMDVYAKTKGKRKAIELMINEIVENKDNLDLDNVMITHTFALEEAKYIYDRLKEELKGVKRIHINTAGCVICSHCGSGSIGILYLLNN